MHIDDLLRMLVAKDASDLHIRAGEPPVMRIHGELTRTEFPPLTGEDIEKLLYVILNEERKRRFEEFKELDLSYAIPGLARFRVNMFRQRGHTGAVMRLIPIRVKTIDELFLPPVTKELALRPRGEQPFASPSRGCSRPRNGRRIVRRIGNSARSSCRSPMVPPGWGS